MVWGRDVQVAAAWSSRDTGSCNQVIVLFMYHILSVILVSIELRCCNS